LLSGRNENLTVNSVTLDNAVREDVLLMKIDVEGWEWSVIKGAAGLLKEFNVENIIMEYSPGEDLSLARS
jgi:FkbM family methyltransferase